MVLLLIFQTWLDKLTEDNIAQLQSGKWLSDKIISASQYILQHQFPNVSGFQCTLYQDHFTSEFKKSHSLQIHLCSGNHWVLSELKKGQVCVYDSLYMGSISESLATQLKALYADGDKSLTISVPRTLQQQGCNDCGCYALAYMVHILHGEDSVKANFDQGKM